MGSSNAGYCYSLQGQCIQPLDYVKDLGIDVDSKLRFDRHISRIVTAAHARISCLLRGFVSRNSDLLKRAYITFVRPLFEYASPMYGVRHKLNILILLNVFKDILPNALLVYLIYLIKNVCVICLLNHLNCGELNLI